MTFTILNEGAHKTPIAQNIFFMLRIDAYVLVVLTSPPWHCNLDHSPTMHLESRERKPKPKESYLTLTWLVSTSFQGAFVFIPAFFPPNPITLTHNLDLEKGDKERLLQKLNWSWIISRRLSNGRRRFVRHRFRWKRQCQGQWNMKHSRNSLNKTWKAL